MNPLDRFANDRRQQEKSPATVEKYRRETEKFLLWLGDDEFPPNAQILFSDNFRYAFTAEDLANIGDILLNRMKAIGASL